MNQILEAPSIAHVRAVQSSSASLIEILTSKFSDAIKAPYLWKRMSVCEFVVVHRHGMEMSRSEI